jgi:2-dehydro-3-deoxygluconokinase
MVEVVTIGETLATVRSETVGPLSIGSPLRLSIAGAESNVAIGLARLGHGVRWAGCVGDDEFGPLVVRTLRGEGIDTSCVRVISDAPTALLVKHQRIARLSRVRYYRSGSAGSRLDPSLASAAVADAPRLLHITGITPALSDSARAAISAAVAAASDAGAHVSFDVNYRAALWPRLDAARTLRPLAQRADTVLASEDEVELVTPEGPVAGAESLAVGGRTVVVKRGADGASVIGPDGTRERRAVSVAAVDSVGAGDAFVAGYLSGLLDGLDAEGRLERACAVAAFAVSSNGDWEGLPTREELVLLGHDPEATIR